MTTYSSKHCAFVDQEERWRKIVSLYQGGELSISTIARRFQITPQAVSRRTEKTQRFAVAEKGVQMWEQKLQANL